MNNLRPFPDRPLAPCAREQRTALAAQARAATIASRRAPARLRRWYARHEGDLVLLATGAGFGLIFGLSI